MFIFVNSFKHSIQINLGSCLNRGYMIFAYIKTLDNVHKASPPVCFHNLSWKGKHAACACACVAVAVAVAVAVVIIVC